MEAEAHHWQPSELRLLIAKAGHSSFQKGEQIFRQGDQAEQVYLIRKGLVEIIWQSYGKERRLALLGRGEVLGEMAVLDHMGRSATAVARTAVDTRTLSRADFEALLDREPALVRRLSKQLVRRLRDGQNMLLAELDKQGLEEAKSPVSIGHYLLKEELGKGAVGVIYRAVHAQTHREYAVKVLTILNDEQRGRFHRECEIMARLIHPNIARIESGGVEAHYGYLAMELLKGETLEQRLKRGPLAETDFTRWFVHSLEALEHAHSLGVLHRDIKPANLFMTLEGAVKLLDFGIARRVQGPEMTVEGRFLGTANYIAPERIGGPSNVLERRSDQYSFGVTMYLAATGRLPFEYEDVADVLAAHLHRRPVPPSRLVALSAPVEAVILRLLEKDPLRRYASIGAAAGALREALAGAGEQPRPENTTMEFGV